MKKNWKLITILILVVTLTYISFDQHNTIEKTERRIRNCEDEKNDLEYQIEDANYKIEELESDLQSCEDKLF
jgi:peptidoglycan hydrolase CwlO-like protein